MALEKNTYYFQPISHALIHYSKLWYQLIYFHNRIRRKGVEVMAIKSKESVWFGSFNAPFDE